MLKHLLFLVFLCFSCLRVHDIDAQAPADQKSGYPQEPFVVEQDFTEIAFENDGTSEQKSQVRVRIQSDAGVQRYAVLTFPYQSSTSSVDIEYVRVRKPDGTLVVTPSENIQDLPSEITRQAPLYSDLREKHVAVKGLGVGDVLEFHPRWKTTKPLAPGQFWFSHDFSRDNIVLQQSLQISVPRNRLVKWRSAKSNPTITETDTHRLFTWTSSQLDRKSKEQEQKDEERRIYQTARGRLPQPEVQLSSFQNWEEIGRWYSKLQPDRAKPTPELRAKAAELTKSLADDRAKTRAIYDYVSRIHYIGIDLGIGRYQSHSGGEVLANQFGDCKDKHTLLAGLLDAVGVQAFPALISTMHDFDPDLPSPAQFDHVISAVWLSDGLTWLDTTPEVSPFAYLVSQLRDKKALLISSDAPAALLTTPADPLQKPLQVFRIDAKLSDTGTLEGKIEWAFQGDDNEVLLRAAFRRTPVPQWKDLIQRVSFGSGFAGEASDTTASSPEKTDEPFHFSYHYVRKDYPDWSNRRIMSPLPPIALPQLPQNDLKPVNPIWLGAAGEVRFESRIELPRGYRPALPKNLDINERFGEYHRFFAYKSGVLTAQRRFLVKLSEVPVTDYEAYKKFSKVVAGDYGLWLPLSLGPPSAISYTNEIWELPSSENADATRAYDEAREKATKNDWNGAIASLKRALEVDPKFTRAGIWLGELYKFSAQTDEAIRAYRQAISVDPQQAVSYKALGYMLLGMQKHEDAIPVWKELVKVAPDDSAGPEGLGSSLMMLKRYAEAKSALEAAAQLDPESPNVQFQLGNAWLYTSTPEKAIEAFRKAVELAPSPWILNNVAFQLAEANEKLAVALEYAKRAVMEQAAASRQVKLSQLRAEDLVPTRSLPSFWDTLGWVYFKMGELDQAEKYLRAAWALSQSPIVGDHLGQVYEHQNKKAAAIHMYRCALSRVPVRASGGDEPMDKTRERLQRLLPQSSSDGSHDIEIANELGKLQITKVSIAAPQAGTAHFFLVFTHNEKTSSVVVEDVKFIGGSESLKSGDTALRSAKFNVPLPADGQPRLLRRGILSCSTQLGCSFTLLNPEDVSSIN